MLRIAMLLNSTHLLLIVTWATLLLVVVRRWRIALLALQLHYLALGGLILESGPTALAGLRILIGGFISVILLLTARRTEHDRVTVSRPTPNRQWMAEFVLRAAACGLVAIGVFGSPLGARFPSLPAELVQASVWLMAMGTIVVFVSRAPLWFGIGGLAIASGVATLYTALDSRLVTAGLLAIGELGLALVIAVAVTFAYRKSFSNSKRGTENSG